MKVILPYRLKKSTEVLEHMGEFVQTLDHPAIAEVILDLIKGGGEFDWFRSLTARERMFFASLGVKRAKTHRYYYERWHGLEGRYRIVSKPSSVRDVAKRGRAA